MPDRGPRFPNESPSYRAARNALLDAEVALRRQSEAVAALRRHLPPGGEIPTDYVFTEGDDGHAVPMSELFGDKDTLVLYSYMYGPKMEKPCPMCTSMLDGLEGNAHHIAQRVSLAVVAKSPIARLRAFSRDRGWTRLRLLSSEGTTYNRDYFGENAEGNQTPMLNVFRRKDGQIRHFFATELMLEPSDPGQNSRHVDSIWPLWNVLDLTPEGRGADFFPKLRYT